MLEIKEDKKYVIKNLSDDSRYAGHPQQLCLDGSRPPLLPGKELIMKGRDINHHVIGRVSSNSGSWITIEPLKLTSPRPKKTGAVVEAPEVVVEALAVEAPEVVVEALAVETEVVVEALAVETEEIVVGTKKEKKKGKKAPKK